VFLLTALPNLADISRVLPMSRQLATTEDESDGTMTLSLAGRLSRGLRSPAIRTLVVVGGIGVLCKVAALGRELLIAARFGASESLDAFLVAVVVPMTISNVVGNVLATSLLPQLLKVRQEQGLAAEVEAQRRAVFWSIVLLALVAVAFALAGPWALPWLSPGFTEGTRELTQRLLWMATPFGVIAGTTRLYAVLAESEGRFARTSFSPLLTAVLSVAVILLAGHEAPWVLVAGLTLGATVELAFNASALQCTRYRCLPKVGRFTAFETTLMAVAWPVSLGAFLYGLTTVVDQSMASLAGPGAVSELTYGNRFVAVVVSLVGTPLLQYAFPQFAKLAAEREFGRLRVEFRRFAFLALAVSVPLMIVLSAMSGLIVEATFQRGRFSPETAERVALVQTLSALQIPSVIVLMLGIRAVFALKLRHIMLYQGLGAVLANVVLDYVLVRSLGVPGIALATAVVTTGTCGFVLLVVRGAIRAEVDGEAERMTADVARAA
jgi:putative peptidoglycan lipid II flippase